MTVILAALRVAWPWILCAVLGAAVGYWVGAEIWRVKYQSEISKNLAGEVAREQAATSALQAQLDDEKARTALQSKLVTDLNDKLNAADADHSHLTDQLRYALSQARPRCPSLPQANLPTGTAAAPQTGSNGQASGLPRLIADAINECRRNALVQSALLDSVTAEVKP